MNSLAHPAYPEPHLGNASRHGLDAFGDIRWLARWRSLAPALFARRGQCRDLPDELRP